MWGEREGGGKLHLKIYCPLPPFWLIEMTVGTLETGTLKGAKDPLLFESLVTSIFFFFFFFWPDEVETQNGENFRVGSPNSGI